MSEVESLEEKSSWGGARPGSGRPKGSMNQETKNRLAVKKAYQDRVAKNADRLFNAQFNLAVGEQYLMWKHKVGTGTKERVVVEVVDDPDVIKAYLDETLDIEDGEWYFISTKPANGMAIDSMLDRSFGKAEAKIDMTTNGNDIGVSISAEQAEQLIRARANRPNL
jgi:hypothetical protein